MACVAALQDLAYRCLRPGPGCLSFQQLHGVAGLLALDGPHDPHTQRPQAQGAGAGAGVDVACVMRQHASSLLVTLLLPLLHHEA